MNILQELDDNRPHIINTYEVELEGSTEEEVELHFEKLFPNKVVVVMDLCNLPDVVEVTIMEPDTDNN
jgi:hypothetical protein